MGAGLHVTATLPAPTLHFSDLRCTRRTLARTLARLQAGTLASCTTYCKAGPSWQGACAPCSCNSPARTQQARARSQHTSPRRRQHAQDIRLCSRKHLSCLVSAAKGRFRCLACWQACQGLAHASTALAGTAGEPAARAASSGHGRPLGQVQRARAADAQRAQPYQFRTNLAQQARQARQVRLLGPVELELVVVERP